MWSVSWAVTLSGLVLNQMSTERHVARGGASVMVVACSDGPRVGQSVRAELQEEGGARNRGASKRRRIAM